MGHKIRLLVAGLGRKGLIAAVSSFLEAHNAYVLGADQHLNPPDSGKWFMRVEMESEGFGLDREEFGPAFAPLARRHGLDWRVTYTDRPSSRGLIPTSKRTNEE